MVTPTSPQIGVFQGNYFTIVDRPRNHIRENPIYSQRFRLLGLDQFATKFPQILIMLKRTKWGEGVPKTSYN